MKERKKTKSRSVNWLQILIGVAGLLIGALVYLVDRAPDQTYFVYNSSINLSFYNVLPNLFGPLGNSLPAFIHVFSFILITAGLTSCQKKGYLIICLSWLIVDISFELGQQFDALAVKIIPDWFVGIPIIGNTENYFLQGTFDFFDLAAIMTGTATAYLGLLLTNAEVTQCKNQI